jgi:hypothetical protein
MDVANLVTQPAPVTALQVNILQPRTIIQPRKKGWWARFSDAVVGIAAVVIMVVKAVKTVCTMKVSQRAHSAPWFRISGRWAESDCFQLVTAMQSSDVAVEEFAHCKFALHRAVNTRM